VSQELAEKQFPVAEVCSVASWGGASLWTGALLRQRIP
jgi:hypothetical protein